MFLHCVTSVDHYGTLAYYQFLHKLADDVDLKYGVRS